MTTTTARGVLGFAAACASLLVSSPHLEASPAVVDAITVDKAVVLVGQSGQLYWRSNATWKRKHGGGVAADLTGAIASGAQVFAVGKRSPLYVYRDGVWHAHAIPNRGTTRPGIGNRTAVSAGKHVYLLRGAKWIRLGNANRSIVAVHARTNRQAYAITSSGQLRRVNAAGSAIIRVTLAPGDSWSALFGAAGETYALTQAGSLFRIRGLSAIAVSLPADLQGLRVHRAAPGSNGVLLAGVVTKDGKSTAVLAGLRRGKAQRLHTLPDLASGDRFAAIHQSAQMLLVATHGGAVHVRKGEGWTTERVSTDLPPAKRTAPGSRPARAN